MQSHNQIITYFQTLGLSEKEANVLFSLYKLGSRPASQIAKETGLERTLTYKVLQKLTKEGFVTEASRKWVTYFFIAWAKQISQIEQLKREQSQQLIDQLPSITSALQQLLDQQFSFAPHITLYDGSFGTQNLFDDLYRTTLEWWRWVVKIVASNTLDAISLSPTTLHNYAQSTFEKLKKKQVSTDIYLANGITIMDELIHSTDIDTLVHIPAGNSAINMYLVGHTLYIVIFEDTPYGIKLSSKVLATLMHFLIEKLKTS